jgi:hypothetical protein
MNFSINGHLLRKAALWIVPLAFLSGATTYAQDGYYDDEHALRHHQRHEKRDLKQHQREERYY